MATAVTRNFNDLQKNVVYAVKRITKHLFAEVDDGWVKLPENNFDNDNFRIHTHFLLLDDNNILRFPKPYKNGCICSLCADCWNPFQTNGACACPGSSDVDTLFTTYQFSCMICRCSPNTKEQCECIQDKTKNSLFNLKNFLEKIESLKIAYICIECCAIVYDKNYNCCPGRKIQSFKCFTSCNCRNDTEFNVRYKAKNGYEYCCQKECFRKDPSVTEVDGLACHNCGAFGRCYCKCKTYMSLKYVPCKKVLKSQYPYTRKYRSIRNFL